MEKQTPEGLELPVPALIPRSTTLRDARRLAYDDSHMREFLLILLDLAVTAAKLCAPGGVRAVIAENPVLKQQAVSNASGRGRR
jgi:hypothetical protein